MPHCAYTGRAKIKDGSFTEKAKRDALLTQHSKQLADRRIWQAPCLPAIQVLRPR